MTAESLGARIGHWRISFRHWRWQRPFWAGLLTLLAGVPIVYIPYADPSLEDLSFRLATTTGAGSLIIGVLLAVLGLSFWFQPQIRVFGGVAAILLGLVSIVVSNFGGFLIGFLLALVGGGMGVSWMPGKPPEPAAEDTDGNGDSGTADRCSADGGATGSGATGSGSWEPQVGAGADAVPGDGAHRAG